VVGTVTVTGAPSGFVAPYIGAGACPDVGDVTDVCANPIFTLAQNGSYSLSLDPGTWVVYGFYEINAFGGAFIGAPNVVTVVSGGTLVANVTVPYRVPATLKAKVTVTNVPTDAPIQNVGLVLCPAGVTLSGGTTPLTCVTGSGSSPVTGSTGTIVMTGLPHGSWTAYPSYCTQFGCSTNAQAGVVVQLVHGETTHVLLTTPFLVPPNGILDATVDVTGAPAGFDDSVGFTACQTTSTGTTCDEDWGTLGTPMSLQLGDGSWEISGEYFTPVFGNAISGPTQTVVIQGGQTTTVTVDVPYQILGTAAGRIKVSGTPAGIRFTGYTVTACPVGVTTLNPFPEFSCVTEYSGPGGESYGPTDAAMRGRSDSKVEVPQTARTPINSYDLPTLTPGQWSLSLGYSTAFGSFFAPQSTTVNVTAGGTTTTKLTTPYQVPTVGAVTGHVSVTGAPEFDFQAGAMACSTLPTEGTCTDEVDAYLGSTDVYALDLAPGTWWVSGVVWIYGQTSTQEITTAPRQVTVSVGAQTKENFTVQVT
jgi:hypothetical protein